MTDDDLRFLKSIQIGFMADRVFGTYCKRAGLDTQEALRSPVGPIMELNMARSGWLLPAPPEQEHAE